MFIEGELGSVELASDYWVRITDKGGTRAVQYPPIRYAWADPAYDLVHASIVACNQDLFAALSGKSQAETTGEDNLRTARLVFGAYRSARETRVVRP